MAQRGKKKTSLSDFFDEDIKAELKREIKEELKKELKKDVFKEKVEEKPIEKPIEKEVHKKKRSYGKILVFLIIIILIVDLLSLYFYYKPNVNLNFISSLKSRISSTYKDITKSKCKDGTLSDTCSNDKPYYCYNGELLKKAATCGCPSGYNVNFQDCKKI